MSTRIERGARSLCAVAVMTGAVVLATAVAATAAEPAAPCCFTNDRVQGTCKVTPREDETCRGILDYLNNPMSSGKSYCENTSIRGGWVHVSCTTGKPVETPKSDGAAPKGESAPQ
ncbi:MAG: hypothetical protein AB2L07_09580 [Thermoanaerobaculaceae bacterium]